VTNRERIALKALIPFAAVVALILGVIVFKAATEKLPPQTTTPAPAAAPVNGDTDPKSRLQAMLNTESGTGTGDAFLVESCSSDDRLQGQSGYKCDVINGLLKKYQDWHIEIASDGYTASAWNTDAPDDTTICDPAC
jgi:hypothetical protein